MSERESLERYVARLEFENSGAKAREQALTFQLEACQMREAALRGALKAVPVHLFCHMGGCRHRTHSVASSFCPTHTKVYDALAANPPGGTQLLDAADALGKEMETVERHAAYDQEKCHCNADRASFEWYFRRARQAIAAWKSARGERGGERGAGCETQHSS